MKMDVICDGQAIGRFDFVCQPQRGDTIQAELGRYVVEDFCHNFPLNRLQVLCSNAEKREAQRSKPVKEVDKRNATDV